jgi:putative DNA primase/helicase
VRFAKTRETVAIAEGIETARSVQQATGISTWAALGSGDLACLELPDCVRDLVIAGDADETGEFAAETAARKFMSEGRKVRIARHRAGKDFNDMLLEGER